MTTALVGISPQLETLIGFEPPARAVELMMKTNLNTELAAQADYWSAADLALQTDWDAEIGETTLEQFEPRNISAGPRRSIIDAPPDRFPALSVMSFITQPKVEQIDQYDTYEFRLFMEVFVKTGPVTDLVMESHEQILARRIQRSTEAAHRVIWRDRTLMSTVREIQLPPRGGIGNQQWVKHEDADGKRYLWQGSRLEYTLQRQARF